MGNAHWACFAVTNDPNEIEIYSCHLLVDPGTLRDLRRNHKSSDLVTFKDEMIYYHFHSTCDTHTWCQAHCHMRE